MGILLSFFVPLQPSFILSFLILLFCFFFFFELVKRLGDQFCDWISLSQQRCGPGIYELLMKPPTSINILLYILKNITKINKRIYYADMFYVRWLKQVSWALLIQTDPQIGTLLIIQGMFLMSFVFLTLFSVHVSLLIDI